MSDTKDDSDVEILEECEESSPKPKLQIFDGNVVISQELTVEEVHSLLAQISSRLVANPADFPNLQASKDEGSEVEVVLEERRQPSTSAVVISVEEHDYSGNVNGGTRNLEHMQIEPDKDGEPIKLPDNLESVPKAEHFPTQRHRWNTNEEIAAILISFDKHCEWQSKEVKIRPKSGSMLLYSRKKVRYRRDGYCWKKRKDGKTTREDHMKLKVQGTECIYGCYVHSAILPTFHRRCYWLLQNPDIVLVHYLNVPYPDDNKLAVIAPSLSLWGDKKEWTKEELVSQLKPMFYSEEEPDLNNELEITTAETVEAIVTQLMEKQRQARAATLNKQLECGCPDSTCADGKTCSHPMRRITAANVKQERQVDNNNQVSSTTGSGVLLSNNAHHQATIHHRVAARADRLQHSGQSHQSPLVLSLGDGTGLSLSQIQAGTGLLILNSSASGNSTNQTSSQSVAMVTSFKCSTAHQTPPLKQYHHPRNKVVVKQESMETNQLCCRQDANAKLDESNGNVSSLGSNVYENSVFAQEKKTLNNAPETPTKAMDTSESTGETTLCLNLASGRDHLSYYNETLDLSQEDIQRTLSANMPLNCSSLNQHRYAGHIPTMTMIAPLKRCRGRGSVQKSPSPHTAMVQEMSPMELMDSPPTVVDDDVFVNLDAFDMLGDFPELEVLDHSNHTSATSLSNDEPACKEVKNESAGVRKEVRGGSAHITDYSPEWAYPEGGVKVLVTGPWYSSTSRYSVLFDSFPVPTSLVQSGVLRCYCPAHEVGLATLQVACEGFVISNSVMFEYKRAQQEDGVTLKEAKVEENENLLKFTLLQRLESVDSRLDIKQEPLNSDMCDSLSLRELGSKLEGRLVRLCQEMTSRSWREVSDESPEGQTLAAGVRGMSLLHMAAWLGFTRLACTLIHWRSENTSSLLEAEVDAMRKDDDGATPLMHSCARGHRETSLVLYRWNRAAIKLQNNRGETAVHLARANGFADMADTLERLDGGLSDLNTFGSSQSSPLVSPSESLASLTSTQSHDGVFLKPDPVAAVRTDRIDTLQYKLTDLSSIMGFGDVHRVVKRPSVDSGIHLGVSQTETTFTTSKPTLSYKTSTKLSRFDRSMSLPLHPPLLSDLLDSPLLPLSQPSSGRRMDFALCEVATAGPPSNSPLGDIDNFSEEETDISRSHVGDQDAQMLTLAEQIIAAIPDRIKIESEEMLVSPREALPPSPLMEPLLDHNSPPSFHFEFSDHNYRYYDVATPSSSMSPASSSLQSPSPSFALDSPSPPPTTQDFCEFFHASASMFENDFSNLTLSDREQRELYEAAKVIQKAYRSYKGRKKDMEDKERAAAVLIQNYYRRYKQYAYFKQMTRAATVIQNTFRTYCEHKRFKKSQEAAVCIQNYYRHYKELGQASPCTGFKRTYSQRRQHQAACKIQQFMRQSKNNHIWEPGHQITERTSFGSRKREAGCPAVLPGCPAKVAISHQFRSK